MMEQYSGDFLAAVDGLRALLGCRGRVWPVSVERRVASAPSTATAPARAARSKSTRASRRARLVRKLWLEPPVGDSSRRRAAIRALRRSRHRSRQLLHEPPADRCSCAAHEAVQAMQRTDHARREPADRRQRDERLHGGRRGHAGQRGDRAPRRRRDRQRRPSARGDAGPLRRRAQGAARSRQCSARRAKSSAARSGRTASRATTGAGWRSRSGRCCRGGLSA